MKHKTTATALLLSIILSTSALAAPLPEGAAGRQADLDTLYSTMVEYHPDLFANTPEEDFLARKSEIEGHIATVDDATFALDLQSLAALVGDSHTGTRLNSALGENYNMLLLALGMFQGHWVLSTVEEQYADYLGWEVRTVNGFTMDQVCDKLSLLISADNPVKLRRQVRQVFGVEKIMVYCGLMEAGQPVTLTLTGPKGEEKELTVSMVSTADQASWPALERLSARRTAVPPTEYVKKTYYFSMPLDKDAYYVQFNQCAEDPDLPMETFTAQVMADLEKGSYNKLLIDLRNNGGGSDGVLVPLLMAISPQVWSGELELWGLIGETTFSSAGINAMEILEMGGHLAGEPASGSVDHFGAYRSFNLPNSGIRTNLSSKFISLAPLLESAMGLGVTPIQPDLVIPQTLEDYLAGRDTLVDTLLARDQRYQAPQKPDAPLTRGRFAQLLYQAARESGWAAVSNEHLFQDCLPFAYYAAGVNWAAANGVASGTGEGTFSAARPITRQEAAVMTANAAKLLGLRLDQRAVLADETAVAPWALDAAEAVSGEGWLELEDGAFSPQNTMTRAQGKALAAELRS